MIKIRERKLSRSFIGWVGYRGSEFFSMLLVHFLVGLLKILVFVAKAGGVVYALRSDCMLLLNRKDTSYVG
jgi:hypothetical protein